MPWKTWFQSADFYSFSDLIVKDNSSLIKFKELRIILLIVIQKKTQKYNILSV